MLNIGSAKAREIQRKGFINMIKKVILLKIFLLILNKILLRVFTNMMKMEIKSENFGFVICMTQ